MDNLHKIAGNEDDAYLIPGRNEQVFVACGYKVNEDVSELKEFTDTVIKEFKDVGIELSVHGFEQPFLSDTIINSSDLLKLPYDVFFKAYIFDIVATEETFLSTVLLKEKYNLTTLEDIVIFNPLYKTENWYSNEINKMACWSVNEETKTKLRESFEMEMGKMPKEITLRPSILKNVITVKSNIPPYIDMLNLTVSMKNFVGKLQILSIQNKINMQRILLDASESLAQAEIPEIDTSEIDGEEYKDTNVSTEDTKKLSDEIQPVFSMKGSMENMLIDLVRELHSKEAEFKDSDSEDFDDFAVLLLRKIALIHLYNKINVEFGPSSEIVVKIVKSMEDSIDNSFVAIKRILINDEVINERPKK